MSICPRCGEQNPDKARFCLSCGTALVSSPPPGEERKIVTVLFADVTGSTGLGERLDPERLKEVMGTYFDAMRGEIEAEGGTVEKFIGDAVMAVFGVPAAHEDDPSRALRAALRIRRRLEDLNDGLQKLYGVALQIRTGINTGEVMAVTAPRPGEALVAGDAVNAAARLEQSAKPGQIVVSQRTARAARGFRLRPLGALQLKGKQGEVHALELMREEVGPERGIPGLRAPMVGRDGELALLRTIYERAATDQRPNLVTIYGDAGMGKSRLTAEFLRSVEGDLRALLVVKGRCLPYGEGITYWPLGEILKGHAGIWDTDPPHEVLEKVRKLTRGLLTPELSADRDRTAAALAYTVGVDDAAFNFKEMAPRQVRVELHASWRSFFSALALDRPVVVLVEDIHWADPAMLDLLEDLADKVHGPVVFVCPARPELTSKRPTWGGGRRSFSSIFLEPLSTSDASRLVDMLLTVADFPSAVQEKILDRAEGNPFFLEEIVRQLIDAGHIVRVQDRWRASGAIESVVIPDTVQGVLAARMDLLPVPDKRALQLAAVVGRVFWTGPVARLLDAASDDVEETLDRLEDRELVLSRLGSSMAGQREFIFKHVLTRDVAYESLPRRDRFRAHAEVAGWIEETVGERRSEFVELLAHHFTQAYQGAAQDGRTDRASLERWRGGAFSYLLDGSSDARSKMALSKAERLAEQAHEIAETAVEKALALELLGLAYILDYQGDLAWRYLKEAADIRMKEVPEDPMAIARVCGRLLEVPTRWPGSMRSRVSREEVEPYLSAGLGKLPHGDSEERVRLLVAKGFWLFAFPEEMDDQAFTEGLGAGEEGADQAMRLGRPDLASAALDAVGGLYIARGLYGPQDPFVERRLEIIRAVEDPWEVGDAHATASWHHFALGRYREAWRFADEGVRRAISDAVGVAVHCMAWRALAAFRLGMWDECLNDLEHLQQLLGDRRDAPPPFAITSYAVGALVQDIRGNAIAADRLLSVVDALSRVNDRQPGGTAAYTSILMGRRGRFDEAWRRLEERSANFPMLKGFLLGSMCDLVIEEGRWDRAAEAASEARRWSDEAGLPALPLFADRVEGWAALSAGWPEEAVELLERASAGFGGLQARWDEALANLGLSQALSRRGDHVAARARLDGAREVFERLGAQRELNQTQELMDALLQRSSEL